MRLCASALAAFLFPAVAIAADLPGQQAAAPVNAYDWTGFYAGASLGYAGGNNWVRSRAVTDPTRNFDQRIWGTSWSSGYPTSPAFLAPSVLAGIQAGYNYQIGHLVVGAELGGSLLGGSGTLYGGARPWGGDDFQQTPASILKTSLRNMATAKLRVGYAMDRMLYYVDGGVVYATVNNSAPLSNRAGFPMSGLANGDNPSPLGSKSKVGAILGVGAEYALDDSWSVRLAYDYVNLGEVKQMIHVPGGIAINQLQNHVSADIYTVGINYKLGGKGFALPDLSAAPQVSWAGWHGGLNAGYGSGQASGSDIYSGLDDSSIVGYPATFNGPINIANRGALLGASVGYDYQDGHLVVGAEGTLLGSLVRGKTQNRNTGSPFGGYITTLDSRLNWVALAQLRAGYATGRALLYVEGGLAAGDMRTLDRALQITQTPAINTFESQVHWGPTVGVGIQYALDDHWSVKTQMNYVMLANKKQGNSTPGKGLMDFYASDTLAPSANKLHGNYVLTTTTLDYRF